MAGEIRSQHTEVFIINPAAAAGEEVVKIGNVTGIGEYGASAGDIITTNLDSVAVEKMSALPDNGDLSLTINVADGDAGHEFIEDNAGSATRYEVIVCDSTGVALPTWSTGTVTMPADRTCRSFLASIKSFRIQGVSPDSVLSASVNFGISGGITVDRPA